MEGQPRDPEARQALRTRAYLALVCEDLLDDVCRRGTDVGERCLRAEARRVAMGRGGELCAHSGSSGVASLFFLSALERAIVRVWTAEREQRCWERRSRRRRVSRLEAESFGSVQQRASGAERAGELC